MRRSSPERKRRYSPEGSSYRDRKVKKESLSEDDRDKRRNDDRRRDWDRRDDRRGDRDRRDDRRDDRDRRDGRDRRERRDGRDDRERRNDRRDERTDDKRNEQGRVRSRWEDKDNRSPKREEPSVDEHKWGLHVPEKAAEPVKEKEKVNLGTSGLLAADTNTYKGVVIKYNEPSDAKKPNLRWRLYPFKGEDDLPVLHIHRQSAYLIGRDHKIADLPVDHPSCSKQHAVLQFRSTNYEKEDGTRAKRIRPYIIDLGSANGTFLNGQAIEAQRYFELKAQDVLKFGFSTREFVILHENSLAEERGEESDLTSSDEEDNE